MLYDKRFLLSVAALAGTSFAQDDSSSSTGTSDSTSTGSAGAECTVSYARLLADAPTPGSDLAQAITSYASSAASSVTAATATPSGGIGGLAGDPNQLLSQACDFSQQLPSSLQSQFDDYATSLISYVSVSSSAIDEVITSCVATGSEGDSYTSFVNSIATHTGPLCTATSGSSTGTDSSTGTGTDTTASPTPTASEGGGGGVVTTTGDDGQTSTVPVPTGAAAVPTAALGGAAAAAAGVLGAAILL
ncbi:hypothetical protein F5B22DRAFT_264573 [Xylaria bambusicola]|uniref:uncharacterized protein n=1 Tax=Xylaria bambusicola TaxID=326684 RepID=UPI0020076AB7|nr:uncharacterized protein F5B22DRAFT_264573 [Xylaria bambusicola]KAI0526011.1 hypothetical protein F5B22DRAFT_264573 [Xylaria bambusicola]